MTFKEIPISEYVLRFWPSDNGWMCGITNEMMDALEQTQRPWVGLTDEEIDTWNIVGHESLREFVRAIEAKLKEKNT